MKKDYTLLLIASYLLTLSSYAQQIISIDFLRSFTTEQIDSTFTANGIPLLVVPTTYAVNAYKITYNTVSYDGITPTFATGALLVPQGTPCKTPLISYQHGTTTLRYGVPSYLSGEIVIGLAEATDGYTIAMPDYLGLGDGPGIHPYIHAASEATASLDMLRATREAQDSLDFALNGQLFLVGYSQGGHATMALHRLIETDFSDEFTVTASAPMSGPYDVSGVQADVIVNDSVYSQPGYLPYILQSYNTVYNLFVDYADVFQSPYDVTLPPLLDGTHDMGELNAAMPSIPNQIMIPEVLDSFINNQDHYFRAALRDNDVYDWTPVSPVKMFYCEADDEVYYMNALVAYDKFIENGATSAELMSAGANFGHFECAFYALSGGKTWFDTFRSDEISLDYIIQPHVSPSFGGVGSIELTIQGGTEPFTFQWSNGDTTQNIDSLEQGIYSVSVTDANGCSVNGQAEVYTIGINEISSTNFQLFPNPFNESTTIKFDETPANATLDIIDLSGKLLRSENISGKNQVMIERKQMSSGTYFLRVTEKDKSPSFAKLIIN
ncbi:MAG: T9SS type A sorting domain-containing protein [Bacteroidia bacterium]